LVREFELTAAYQEIWIPQTFLWDPVEKNNQFVLFNANFGFQPNGRVDRGGQITMLADTGQ
jgi:hypothetical protein